MPACFPTTATRFGPRLTTAENDSTKFRTHEKNPAIPAPAARAPFRHLPPGSRFGRQCRARREALPAAADLRRADRSARHRHGDTPLRVAAPLRAPGRCPAQLPDRGCLGQPAAAGRRRRLVGLGLGTVEAFGGSRLRGASADGPDAMLVARHRARRKGQPESRLPHRPLRHRPDRPGIRLG